MQERAIEEALDVLRPGLDSDGFSLKLGELGAQGTVQIILEAGPEACIDCLVPEDIMVKILESAIREKGESLDHIEIVKVGFDVVAEP